MTEREAMILIFHDCLKYAAQTRDSHGATERMLTAVAKYDREHKPPMSIERRRAISSGMLAARPRRSA